VNPEFGNIESGLHLLKALKTQKRKQVPWWMKKAAIALK